MFWTLLIATVTTYGFLYATAFVTAIILLSSNRSNGSLLLWATVFASFIAIIVASCIFGTAGFWGAAIGVALHASRYIRR